MIALVVALSTMASASSHPPPPVGEWITDETGKVSASTRAEVNRLAAEINAAGAGQLGVLVTRKVEGSNPRGYATAIFNHWGIGRADRNDGMFLFIAVDDRKAEIVYGSGGPIDSSQTDVVMRDDVVANMKRGSLDQAVLAATRSLSTLMNGARPNPLLTTGLDSPSVDDVLGPFADGTTSFPEHSPRSWVIDLSQSLNASQRGQLNVAASDIYASDKGRIFFLVVDLKAAYPTIDDLAQKLYSQVKTLDSSPAGVIALDIGHSLRAAIVVPPEKAPTYWERGQVDAARERLVGNAQRNRMSALVEAQQFVQTALTTGIPARPMQQVLAQGIEEHSVPLAAGGGGALLGGLAFLSRWNRKRVRQCKACNVPRERLDEQADDAYLLPAQRKEEEIKSVDYDVWRCGRCSDVLVLDYSKWFSGYGGCTSCRAKTMSRRSTTLVRATYDHGGTEQIDENCVNCSYTNTYTRHTARLQRSSSSSSSSSGSSFGGGSSSGGGSSGSW